MNIAFKIDPDRMTLGDRIAFEEQVIDGKRMRWTEMRDMLAHHMVDENRVWLDYEKACKVLKPLTMTELEEVISKFYAMIEEVGKAAIPPEQDNG